MVEGPKRSSWSSGTGVRVIAHRGFAGVNPENTIQAVRSAATDADAVEVDVQRCASGELVVFHDDTLDRLTAGTGPVREHSFDELSGLTVADSAESIPTLDALVAAVPSEVGINVELKHDGMGAEILDVADAVPNDILVSSFDRTALTELDEQLPTALIFADSFEANLEIAEELGCACVHPDYRLCTTARVDAAHDRGLCVNTWTVPHGKVEGMRACGCDGVFLDRPLNT